MLSPGYYFLFREIDGCLMVNNYFLQDSRLPFFNDLILFAMFTFKLHQPFQDISFPYYLIAHMRIYLMHSIFSGKF